MLERVVFMKKNSIVKDITAKSQDDVEILQNQLIDKIVNIESKRILIKINSFISGILM